MSWLSKGLKGLGDWVSAPAKAVNNNIYKPIERWIGSKIPHVSAEERRTALQAANEQISYYKESKNQLETAKKEADTEKMNERNRINESEIRAKQRMYRRAGFMSAPSNQPKDTLG